METKKSTALHVVGWVCAFLGAILLDVHLAFGGTATAFASAALIWAFLMIWDEDAA